MSCSRTLGISWRDEVTNNAVVERAGIPTTFTLLKRRRTRWLGHVCRTEDGRTPKDLLYGELVTGKRPTGRTPHDLLYGELVTGKRPTGLIPKDLVYDELVTGKRPTGRPQLGYKDTCKRDLKALGINTDTREAAAADRSTWT